MNDKFIEEAAEQFKVLLSEQLFRQELLEKGRPKEEASQADKTVIGLIDGDGIGPVIMAVAEKILKTLLKEDISSGKIILRKIKGLTLENRLARGKTVPDDVLAEIQKCSVLLKGPTTTPKGGTLESANVYLRRKLDLYANIRPVCIPEKGIDWCFFRENTEGMYALGSRGIDFLGKLSMDFKVTTRFGTERIAEAAFDYARKNGKNRVTIVTKANILKKTDGMFSEIAHEVGKNYSGITADDCYIDIMCANLLNERVREAFQVFLLPNLYGDIITDEAAQIQGGVGTAGSANIGGNYAMFEAIHGSAPAKIRRGEGDYANPESILSAAEMLLCHIGKDREASKLKNALFTCRRQRKVFVTGHKDGATTKEYGDYLLENL